MVKRKIYVILKGRLGNQLFIYAFARNLQKKLGEATELIIDDTEIIQKDWENTLTKYNLPKVRFVHTRKELYTLRWFFKFFILKLIVHWTKNKTNYRLQFYKEYKIKPFLEKMGVFNCENGFLDFKVTKKKNILINGYFQSEKYFPLLCKELHELFCFEKELEYPNLGIIESSNTVCITVRRGDYVGNPLYDLCGEYYWKEAINYIINNVQNPVFFVCSDNIDYVKENLIDCERYTVIFQDYAQPIYKTLAAMSRCKYFIIANSSFSWWAQYLSSFENKITVAPNQWMLVDMPIDIYQDNWHLIDVKKYLGDKAL